MKKLILTFCCGVILEICSAQPSVNIVPFASGFTQGISDIANAKDSRLFVVEQLGYISIIDSAGNVLPNYFLDISSKVTPTTFTPGNEQGLLGLAFSPTFAVDGYFYVNYTNKTGAGNTTISRFSVSANPNIADPLSEEVLLNIYQPFANHNGGGLAFGGDGYLYIALGDGGDAGDPDNRAQNLDSLLGKILRIDVSNAPGYTIPPNNPYISGNAPEIWAYGLRNPWKISFDRNTNDLWIGDVGQGAWEEIDFQPANSAGGENYGWRCYEGTNPYDTTGCSPTGPYIDPIYEYSHNATGGCAVTGGYVYRGIQSLLNGYYLFSDYCNGEIYSLSPTYTFASAGSFPGNLFTTFGEDYYGELYIGSQSNGTVYRIETVVTGIENTSEMLNGMTIYPNPTHGKFTCEINSHETTNATIEITDMLGRICYSDQVTLSSGINTFEMSLENLSSGSYQMKINSKNSSQFKKLEIF